jgi:mannose-6-phosphate isomerase-like protein (cupin superfamily)
MQAAEVINDSRGGRIEVWPNGRPANGAHYWFDWFLAPGGGGLPEHFHPHQEERLAVVSGQLSVRMGRQTMVLGPGQRVAIPAGVRHLCGNNGTAQAHVRGEFVPGLDMHRFLSAFFAIERSRSGLRRWAAWALLCADEPEHVGFPSGLGVALRLVAPLARPLGCRPPS